jgi:glycosyltransferase involved in cell wall biosynthesis
MRVAYISADPGVPVFGRKGCSVHVQEVLRAMSARGAEIDLFATSLGGDPPPGLETVRVQPLPPAPKGDLHMREQMSRAANADLQLSLRSAKPFDFVYERYSLWSYGGMNFARQAGIPGLLEINAPLIEEQSEHRGLVDRAGAEAIAERVFKDASVLLAVSEEVAAYVEGFLVTAGKVRVVPNGVDPGRFPPGLPPSLPAPPGTFTIGFVGTLKPWHGVEILTEAFARLREKNPRARLLIVGDGPERENLQADLARRALSTAAHFTGAVPAREVPGLLASMSVAVAPYPELARFYFSPLKVYEYMAAGLPVVASKIGQLTRLIHTDVTGLLVQPGDAADLASALERLSRDPALCEQLGKSARAAVLRDHTWDAVVGRIFEFAGVAPSTSSLEGLLLRQKTSVPR